MLRLGLIFLGDVTSGRDTSPVTHVAIPYQSGNNLPCVMGKMHSDDVYAFCAPTNDNNVTKGLKRTVCMTEMTNTNLTAAQKKLLRWHYHLGYIGMRHVQ